MERQTHNRRRQHVHHFKYRKYINIHGKNNILYKTYKYENRDKCVMVSQS